MLCNAFAWGPQALAQQAPAAAQAEDELPGPISLELNRLEPQGAACRVWILLKNQGEAAVDPLRLDLLVFGKDGVIGRRLALDVGPVPGRKTLARIFDLSNQSCDGVGALLLNDVLLCGGADPAQRAACLPRLTTSSRAAGVSFDK
ncbi:Tat pathway signal protein [Acetobacteraceae bacterium H6797]|nr:Tat pathway signal protein [Acetobacteraceae bacterium H6797]